MSEYDYIEIQREVMSRALFYMRQSKWGDADRVLREHIRQHLAAVARFKRLAAEVPKPIVRTTLSDRTEVVECPYCHHIFTKEYYENQHVPCPEPTGDIQC